MPIARTMCTSSAERGDAGLVHEGLRGRAASANRRLSSAPICPVVTLNFSPSPDAGGGTRGRAIDHIGFEVKNLEAFAKKLDAQGIMLDRPVPPVPALGISIAFVTDPWGTYIELTEGLDKINKPDSDLDPGCGSFLQPQARAASRDRLVADRDVQLAPAHRHGEGDAPLEAGGERVHELAIERIDLQRRGVVDLLTSQLLQELRRVLVRVYGDVGEPASMPCAAAPHQACPRRSTP